MVEGNPSHVEWYNKELERMEQERQKESLKGFPVWLVVSPKEYKVFFTYKAMDEYVKDLDECQSILLHVDDVREVSYKL